MALARIIECQFSFLHKHPFRLVFYKLKNDVIPYAIHDFHRISNHRELDKRSRSVEQFVHRRIYVNNIENAGFGCRLRKKESAMFLRVSLV